MRRFTDAGRKAIADGNLYAALSLALMMPDICASIEDAGPGKSQARYVRWCKRWVEPKFTRSMPGGTVKVFVSSEDCFQLRCSLIHSGRANIDPSKQVEFERFEFFDQTMGSHLNYFTKPVHNGVVGQTYLQLKADRFSNTLFNSADEWDAFVAGEATISSRKI
jgi:hypothetical protein